MNNSHEFHADIKVDIYMTNEEFETLFEAAAHHYDSTIKTSTEVGGWLYGRKMHRTPWPNMDPKEELDMFVQMNQRELNLCMKTLEMHFGNKKQIKLAVRLTRIFHELQREWKSINSILNYPRLI